MEKKDQVQTNGKTPEAATKVIAGAPVSSHDRRCVSLLQHSDVASPKANLLESSLGTCGGSRKLATQVSQVAGSVLCTIQCF